MDACILLFFRISHVCDFTTDFLLLLVSAIISCVVHWPKIAVILFLY